MKLINKEAEIFVPDNISEDQAIKRTTHMGICAHQDDLEVMAYDGILKCFRKEKKWFLGIVVTDGGGSPRSGIYANYSDKEMNVRRKLEQKKAAFIGEYGAAIQLDYKSSEVKDSRKNNIVKEIKNLIIDARPDIIYTHNLADKHDTHVGVGLKVIQALREIPKKTHPKKIYGCEVWRGLDWLMDDDKIMFDVSLHPNIACSLLGVFDSQISGGKRYNNATIGRRVANATFDETHKTDKATDIIYAMDLTPLISDIDSDITKYILNYINNFKDNIINRIKYLSI